MNQFMQCLDVTNEQTSVPKTNLYKLKRQLSQNEKYTIYIIPKSDILKQVVNPLLTTTTLNEFLKTTKYTKYSETIDSLDDNINYHIINNKNAIHFLNKLPILYKYLNHNPGVPHCSKFSTIDTIFRNVNTMLTITLLYQRLTRIISLLGLPKISVISPGAGDGANEIYFLLQLQSHYPDIQYDSFTGLDTDYSKKSPPNINLIDFTNFVNSFNWIKSDTDDIPHSHFVLTINASTDSWIPSNKLFTQLQNHYQIDNLINNLINKLIIPIYNIEDHTGDNLYAADSFIKVVHKSIIKKGLSIDAKDITDRSEM